MESSLYDRQLAVERAANDFSTDRLLKSIQKRIDSGQADELGEGKLILITSIDKVAIKITEYFNKDIRGKMKAARDVLAEEFYDTPRDLAFVLLVTIVRSISKDVHVPTTRLLKQINRTIHDSMLVRALDRADTTHSAYVDKRYKKRSESYRRSLKIKIANKRKELGEADLDSITTYLGATLIDILLASGTNLIEKKTVYNKGKKQQLIGYTEECFKMVLQSRDKLLVEYRKFPILLTKPVPWSQFKGSGGYLWSEVYKVPMIKTTATSRGFLKAYFDAKDTDTLSDTLNTIQETPWKVNRKVFEIMDKVFQENIVDPMANRNNPYLIGNLPYNGSVEPEDFINVHDYGELHKEGRYKGLPLDKKSMVQYFNAIEYQRDIIISNIGKATMLNLVLFNAKEYLEEERFYFSYQYDFRGRIYPIQQHLQPQGKSEVKALLLFANGCKLKEGDESLHWFLIHGANCYGYDKEPYSDRVSNILAKEEEILQIAENPMQYQTLWKDTDSPYLFLAWCFEYAEYLKDPDNFLSYIPIALDATCSGIQIYSGLLKDKLGALAVNVIGDTRSDIYKEVAKKVNSYLEKGETPDTITYKDSTGKSITIEVKQVCASLKGKITRKLTKRNTMTVPYSVTKFGMYEQLQEELSLLENNNEKFWVGKNWVVAKLLTDLNDSAITETVKGARIGQEFLKEVTKDKVNKGGWVFYTTPVIGFPVLQKIHKTKVERIVTPIGKLSIRVSINEIHTIKMVNGIAPNFIHSLDSTLLSLTLQKMKASECDRFHFIHDSFGVPASFVKDLNKAVRESYVEIFETNPLETWALQVNPDFSEKAKEVMLNDLDLKEVMNSEYIFS